MKVLVTGFGPFPGVPHNVSSELAEYCVTAWSTRPEINADCVVLATEWQTAPAQAAQYIAERNPDIVIHLGVSEHARNLVLETHAYNACCDTPDDAGTIATTPVLHPDRPDRVSSSAPVARIAERLTNAGHKVTVSDDPGRYLCNAVYHETLTLDCKCGRTRQVIFIHIPTVLSENTISWAQAIAGLDHVLDVMRQHLLSST